MTCAGATPFCWNGACDACQPGSVQCSGNSVETCSSAGTWGAPVGCGGEACVGGVCDASMSCLDNIPASCPDCQVMNGGDLPYCRSYLACYIANDCDPNSACGQGSGVCSANTIGGGQAPLAAAIATYACACP